MIKPKKPTKKQVVLICVNALLLLLALVCSIFSGYVKTMLVSQQGAERWSVDGERYGQVSAYIAQHKKLDTNYMGAVLVSVNRELEEQSINLETTSEGAQVWTYGYSGEAVLDVASNYSKTAQVRAMGVGGNFFLFYPVNLISGAYFFESDINQDQVLLDQDLAWRLFGGLDVTGMEVKIGDRHFIVAGVFAAENNFATKMAYGDDMPRLFLSYSVLSELDENAVITSVQALLPDPISGFAADTLGKALDSINVTVNDRELVDNTHRFSLFSLVDVIRSFGSRSMRQVGLSLPYWENAARVAEDWAALLLVIFSLLLVFPLVCAVLLIIHLWRNKRWDGRTVKAAVESKVEDRRERKREEKALGAPKRPKKRRKKTDVQKPQARPEQEDAGPTPVAEDMQFSVSEIVRSVLESEDKDETDQ